MGPSLWGSFFPRQWFCSARGDVGMLDGAGLSLRHSPLALSSSPPSKKRVGLTVLGAAIGSVVSRRSCGVNRSSSLFSVSIHVSEHFSPHVEASRPRRVGVVSCTHGVEREVGSVGTGLRSCDALMLSW